MEPSTKARRGNALELFYYLCAVYRYKLRLNTGGKCLMMSTVWLEEKILACLICCTIHGRGSPPETHTHTCSTFTRTRRCTFNIDNVFYWYLLIYLHVYIYKIYIYMINYMHYVLRCFQNRSESIQWVGSFICIQWRLTLLSCQVGENCCMPAGLGWNMLKPSETFV